MVLRHKSASAQALVLISVGEQGKMTRAQNTLQITGTYYEHMSALEIKVYPENVYLTITKNQNKTNDIFCWFGFC